MATARAAATTPTTSARANLRCRVNQPKGEEARTFVSLKRATWTQSADVDKSTPCHHGSKLH